ncbi:MAG: MarR family transcriptional regulator [Deltaproteobacteria bacterium]|nr:MarR family transcriptional regulator [Deltaproteobacteria bacterium]
MKLLFPLDESPSFWLYRAHTQGAAALRRDFLAAGFDLTPEQWGIMTRIRDNEGISQSQLCEKTFKDRHNINRIINILEKRGYTERRPDEDDKRAYRLFLTESGMDALKKSTPIVLKHFRKRFSGISDGDLAALHRILVHIVNNIKNIDEQQKSEAIAVINKNAQRIRQTNT